jgi:hypothetical protein
VLPTYCPSKRAYILISVSDPSVSCTEAFARSESIPPSRTSISADYLAILNTIGLNAFVYSRAIRLEGVLIGGQSTDPHGTIMKINAILTVP